MEAFARLFLPDVFPLGPIGREREKELTFPSVHLKLNRT
jgi:hypothetical protein